MSSDMDRLCAGATAGARAWNEGGAAGGGFMPSRSEIADDRLSADLARELRERHGRANCYRMAEAIVAEERSLADFEEAYGGLPQTGEACADFLDAVRSKVDELGGLASVNEQVEGDVIAQLLAIADDGGDDAEDGAGAGRSARAEEPRPAFGEERQM